jgi:hypothetical protein
MRSGGGSSVQSHGHGGDLLKTAAATYFDKTARDLRKRAFGRPSKSDILARLNTHQGSFPKVSITTSEQSHAGVMYVGVSFGDGLHHDVGVMSAVPSGNDAEAL